MKPLRDPNPWWRGYRGTKYFDAPAVIPFSDKPGDLAPGHKRPRQISLDLVETADSADQALEQLREKLDILIDITGPESVFIRSVRGPTERREFGLDVTTWSAGCRLLLVAQSPASQDAHEAAA